MKKLESKYIVPYLPYNLKVEMLDCEIDYVGKKYDEIIGIHQWDKQCLYWSVLTVGGSKPNISRIKPILRPLSDLTKEIEHNGKKFVPIVELEKIRIGIDIYRPMNLDYPIEINIETENYSQTIDLYDGYLVIQKLFEWHFDVFGLIDSKLALNINEV